jgi:hypothetical protein
MPLCVAVRELLILAQRVHTIKLYMSSLYVYSHAMLRHDAGLTTLLPAERFGQRRRDLGVKGNCAATLDRYNLPLLSHPS